MEKKIIIMEVMIEESKLFTDIDRAINYLKKLKSRYRSYNVKLWLENGGNMGLYMLRIETDKEQERRIKLEKALAKDREKLEKQKLLDNEKDYQRELKFLNCRYGKTD
jgi:hypothetical protein